MDQQKTVEEWAKYVIERWEMEIIRLKINRIGQLLKSFTNTVYTQSGGNVEKIIFAFEYYGKFSDMGVGRGVKVADVPNSRRTPKPWYNKVFFSQVKRLAEILIEQYQQEAILTIVSNLESYDNQGNKQSSSSGSHSGGRKSQIDPTTGQKKMTYSEFKKKNQNQSWWKGGND